MEIKAGDKLWLYAPEWATNGCKRVPVVVQSSSNGQLMIAPAREAGIPGSPYCAIVSKR